MQTPLFRFPGILRLKWCVTKAIYLRFGCLATSSSTLVVDRFEILGVLALRSLLVILSLGVAAFGAPPPNQPDMRAIVEKSVAANDEVFKMAPDFNYKERDREKGHTKTYQVTMIDGTPYQRLIVLDGKPLSGSQFQEEQKKEQQARSERRSESPEKRNQRIQKYQRDRQRDHEMIQELTKAFNFTYMGQQRVRGFSVYALKATPRPGYQPSSMQARVLTGMQGSLWIDQKTYRWVRVSARVIHPVSIEGFLAEVEPGTQFLMETSPVTGGMWQISHFAMKSQAKILHMVTRGSQEDDTFFDYQYIGNAKNPSK